MTRFFAFLAVTLVVASPAFAGGPTRASEINIDLVTLSTRSEAEELFPRMSAREIDILLHRVCEQQSMAMLDL